MRRTCATRRPKSRLKYKRTYWGKKKLTSYSSIRIVKPRIFNNEGSIKMSGSFWGSTVCLNKWRCSNPVCPSLLLAKIAVVW